MSNDKAYRALHLRYCDLELELAAAHDALRIANASAVEHVIDRVMYQQRVKALRDKAREDALELAAQLCDSEATIEGIAQKCAAAIRALKKEMKRRLTNTTFFDGYTTTGESTEQKIARLERELAAALEQRDKADYERGFDDGFILRKEKDGKRTWVGLTKEEAAKCWSTSAVTTWKNFEAKLKEKNGG